MPDTPVDKPVPSEEESGTRRRASPTPEEIRKGIEEGLEWTRARAHGMSVSEFAASQMAERDALELDNLTRDVEFITGPALSSEVLDYEDLPTMPDFDGGDPRGFYASISWNGVGYEWYTVRHIRGAWVPIMGKGGLSSENALVGTKTEKLAHHETHITYLPDGLIVRMHPYETGYVFRMTLENTFPRNVLKADPTGSEDSAEGDSWRVDDQAGNAGFILPVSVGCAYNDGEDGLETLWGYYVALEVSCDGRIVAVSSPTKYPISVPDAC